MVDQRLFTEDNSSAVRLENYGRRELIKETSCEKLKSRAIMRFLLGRLERVRVR